MGRAFAPLAPFAAPSSPPPQATRPANTLIARSALSPLGPSNAPSSSPVAGFPSAVTIAPGQNPYTPMAPVSEPQGIEMPGGGGKDQTSPGGPQGAIQFNQSGDFAGDADFQWNTVIPTNKYLTINGNLFFTPGNGVVSAASGTLQVAASGVLTLLSNTGIQLNAPSSGFVSFFGFSCRQTSATFNGTALNVYANGLAFQVQNFNGDLTALRVNTTPGAGSSIRFAGLPTSPAGLTVGDVWINGVALNIVTVSLASRSKKRASRLKARASRILSSALTYFASVLKSVLD